MFGFLKDKIKQAVDVFSKKAEDELKIEKKSKKEDKTKEDKKTQDDKSGKKDKSDKKKEKPKEKSKKEPKEKEKQIQDKKIKEKKETKEEKEGIKEEKKEEKAGFFGKLFGKKEEKEKKGAEKEDVGSQTGIKAKKEAQAIEFEEEVEEGQEEIGEAKEEKKQGFFGMLGDAITKKTLSEEKFEEMFWDLEIGLLESNVALEVIEKIKDDLKSNMINERFARSSIEEAVLMSLKKSIDEILTFEKMDVVKRIKEKKEQPYVIVFVGVNGSGKTTSLAKIASYLKGEGLSVVMAAGDTFRAAAIHQLEIHADKIGVKIIKQDYGSDAAAVAFDAIAHAKANKKDVVLIDTAGRSHANVNLMDELRKVIRVAKPDMTLFVGDSITGNDMVEQARQFNAAVNVDGLVLSKADVDEKGGATISATYVTKKPIVFIGTGQEYSDIEEFDKAKVMKNLEL